MEYPLKIRLWLKDLTPGESTELQERRKLLSLTLDGKTGKHFVEIKGHDGFAVAKLVPSALVEFITMRQELPVHALTTAVNWDKDKYASEELWKKAYRPGNLAMGVYLHEDVEIILEASARDKDSGNDMRQIYIVGKELAKIEEAYRLFRESRLPLRSPW
jgi:hypothetical protein